ncbi:MAG TPA: septal ring lytic transglycosylase RlpA family protein [Rubrobacteraceae bacterium]|nr:septal ring lytic transglycosylase RlpA family protein [Rubrobacteraceae bacterium]
MKPMFKAAFAAGATAAFMAAYGVKAEAEPVVSSWYGPGFEGSETANGEVYTTGGYTAAHPSLPFGTEILITYGERQAVVRVNDRGPYAEDRGLDLSQAAAEEIGLDASGADEVDLRVLADSTSYDSTSYDSTSYQLGPSDRVGWARGEDADEGVSMGYQTHPSGNDLRRSYDLRRSRGDRDEDVAFLLEPRPSLKFWARRSLRIRDRLPGRAMRPR